MKTSAHSQQGVFLIEALIGILIFSLGVLAMVALGTTAVSAQSDAQYRTEAANLANEIASEISLNADRRYAKNATPAQIFTLMHDSITPFEHNPAGGGCTHCPAATCSATCRPTCPFTAAPSGEAVVTDWAAKVALALPGVAPTGLQIDTTTLAAFNGVRVTVCWQAPADQAVRSYILVTYIN